MPSEAGSDANHLPVNHWLGVRVFSSPTASAKQQVAVYQTSSHHPCCYSSAADVILSLVDSQLAIDPVTRLARSTSSPVSEADSLAVCTYVLPLSITTEVSGMVLTSDVSRYTHAALQLLSCLRHPYLRTLATPQLPAALGDTQVIFNIFTNAQPAGSSGNDKPCWLNIQYTATLTTRLFEPGTQIASAAPPSTAVALQPSVQRADLMMDESLLHGMCLIEGTLVSNESFTLHTDTADLTGQFTLDGQDTDRYSNFMSSLCSSTCKALLHVDADCMWCFI